MEPGRIWQRGASKGRKGSTNARMMQSSGYQDNSDQKRKNNNSDSHQNDFGEDQLSEVL